MSHTFEEIVDLPGSAGQAQQRPGAEAEAAVLGACLMASPGGFDPIAAAAAVLGDQDRDFAEPHHGVIWQAVLALHARSRPTGVPMVEAELRSTGDLERVGGLVRLSQIAHQACSPGEAEHYAHLVHGYARQRRYEQTLVRGMQMARQADPSAVNGLIAAHQAELEHLAADQGPEQAGLFGKFHEGLQEHLDTLEHPVIASAITGLTDLDMVLKMRPGNMILVAARPAMGKSALTLGIALANAGSDRPTLVHSLEMGKAEVTNRVLSSQARVGLHHLTDGGPAITEDDWSRIARRLPDLDSLPLWMDYTARVTPHLVRTRIKHIVRTTGRVPLVVIDYIQLMETDQRNSRQTAYERVSEVSRELKIIAEETGAVIVCCAQLNRGSENREGKLPQTSDLRDSGQLEQDASAVILLHREDAYDKASPRAGESDLIVSKNRGGVCCTVTVAHQFHYSRLRDMHKT
ncbi:replicative DNA helicase [Streptomyces genisteinicus]|uniref:DNA 5'-3' helicase n=1 Tax=Streptomyces genisteinicus TaxID=2768068 RepID=A0A7H0I591_9ACTN|nr:DnaB-like helicase C-terminal domain-containing protein [Streptomyces genisteinicus]QNP67957.1 AAA family ATPase [Streptomyces genisteinicus]